MTIEQEGAKTMQSTDVVDDENVNLVVAVAENEAEPIEQPETKYFPAVAVISWVFSWKNMGVRFSNFVSLQIDKILFSVYGILRKTSEIEQSRISRCVRIHFPVRFHQFLRAALWFHFVRGNSIARFMNKRFRKNSF